MKIEELKKMADDYNQVEIKNQKIYHDHEKQTMKDLIEAMKADGILNEAESKDDVTIYSYSSSSLNFSASIRVLGSDMTFAIDNTGKCTSISISGISASLRNTEETLDNNLSKIGVYYARVSQLTEALRAPHPNLIKMISNYVSPEFAKWDGPSISEIKEQISDIERDIELASIRVGDKLILLVHGNRRRRIEVTVQKVNNKTFLLVDNFGEKYYIRREDMMDRTEQLPVK